ncbi:hypothetical protein JW851_04905 [Candidatus Woesearchaeota archaeon]|nr:hypothetical protein [Candidatus Woesearchaeota archaeon]
MNESVFDQVPGLKENIEPSTVEYIQNTERRISPGGTERFSGEYENIRGMVGRDLGRRDLAIEHEKKKMLLEGVRRYFLNIG